MKRKKKNLWGGKIGSTLCSRDHLYLYIYTYGYYAKGPKKEKKRKKKEKRCFSKKNHLHNLPLLHQRFLLRRDGLGAFFGGGVGGIAFLISWIRLAFGAELLGWIEIFFYFFLFFFFFPR